MKKILITGGLGFAGSVLTDFFLKKNFIVVVVDKILFDNKQLNFYKKKKNFFFYKEDIIFFEKLEKIFNIHKFDIVIHLAAIVGDPACKVNTKLTNLTNLVASKNIFKLCENYNVNKFIFFSTCSNYGLSSGKKLLKETDKLQPLSLYAKSKVDFENFLIRRKSKVKRFILRISTLYGISRRMRFDLTINEFTKKIYKNEKFDVFHADTWRPYLNLKDLAKIIYRIAVVNNPRKLIDIYNVGYNSQNFTKKNIIDEILKIKRNSNIFKYVKTAHFDKRNYRVDFSKISKLKIQKNITLNAGIKELINYLTRNKKINTNKNIFYNHK